MGVTIIWRFVPLRHVCTGYVVWSATWTLRGKLDLFLWAYRERRRARVSRWSSGTLSLFGKMRAMARSRISSNAVRESLSLSLSLLLRSERAAMTALAGSKSGRYDAAAKWLDLQFVSRFVSRESRASHASARHVLTRERYATKQDDTFVRTRSNHHIFLALFRTINDPYDKDSPIRAIC